MYLEGFTSPYWLLQLKYMALRPNWFLLLVSVICARYAWVKALYWDELMAATGVEGEPRQHRTLSDYVLFYVSVTEAGPGFTADTSGTGVMGRWRDMKLVGHGLSEMHSRRSWSEPKKDDMRDSVGAGRRFQKRLRRFLVVVRYEWLCVYFEGRVKGRGASGQRRREEWMEKGQGNGRGRGRGKVGKEAGRIVKVVKKKKGINKRKKRKRSFFFIAKINQKRIKETNENMKT